MELLSLSRKELDRLSVIERVDRSELTQIEAAALMKRSTRQIRRWLVRYRNQGERGLISRRRGQPSNNRLNNMQREAIVTIIASQYADFWPTFANEMLAERTNASRSPHWLQWMPSVYSSLEIRSSPVLSLIHI